MILLSLRSAFPGVPMSQPEVWEALSGSPAIQKLSRRGRRVLKTILRGDSGIDTRHFAIAPPGLFSMDAEALAQAFEREAPALASQALSAALEEAHLLPKSLDALFLCTSTGYLCPGVSSYVAGRLGLRPDAVWHDLVGHGCGAALPALQAASCFLSAHPQATVAVVAVEICSAAFFLCDDPGALVSACLFGDGASASLWRSDSDSPAWRAGNFHSLHLPGEREKIRFVNDGGYLRNQLHRDVPEVAARAVRRLFETTGAAPDRIIAHCGGRDVTNALEAALPDYRLDETRATMRRYGNLGGVSALVAFEERFRKVSERPERVWLTAFGTGFSVHSCDLTWPGTLGAHADD